MAKQSYASLTKQIATLQAQADELREQEKKGVIGRIKVAIEAYGLTPQDLFGRPAKTTPQTKTAKAARALYSDGNGNTWSGRGSHPRWLRDALASGRTMDEFMGGGRQASAPEATASGGPSRGRVKARKSAKLKPKYQDEAGNTWSGRGLKPRWLSAALAAGKKLEDFAI